MSIPGEIIEREFLAVASEDSKDMDMDFEVLFGDPVGKYVTVKIKLYLVDTNRSAQWAGPPPEVQVTWYRDKEEDHITQTVQLTFDQEFLTAFFHTSLEGWVWKDFLLIGMEFEAVTINYTCGPNGTLAGTIWEMRRVTLLSTKTYAEGDKQIWGKKYVGRGKSLGIEGGLTLKSEFQ